MYSQQVGGGGEREGELSISPNIAAHPVTCTVRASSHACTCTYVCCAQCS